MANHPTKILALAKRGAEAQLRDLLYEARLLIELFPHLRDAFDKDELPLKFIMAKGAGRLTRKPAKSGRGARRQPVSAAKKKPGRG